MKSITWCFGAWSAVVLLVGWNLTQSALHRKADARLDKLEAAITVAQQPHECHYLFHNDTLFLENTWIRCVDGTRLEWGGR